MSGLRRRVAALEVTRVGTLYRREAERLAQQYGGTAATHLEERRATAAAVVSRFGPRPDMRQAVRWAAEARGLDPDEVERQYLALKEARWASTNPSGGARRSRRGSTASDSSSSRRPSSPR